MNLFTLLCTTATLSGCSPQLVDLPRDVEIALAQSALPSHLREDATIYVYDPAAGYRVEIEGSNGFHALVGRDDPAVRWASFTFDQYPDDFLIPVAFDETGAQAQLRPYLDLGKWRAEGVPAEEAQQRLRAGFERGDYAPPGRAGVAYMLSPLVRSYARIENDATVGTFMFPHYMFYAPGLTNRDLGNSPDIRNPVMRPSVPDPHGMIIVVVGQEERNAYREASAGLLAELCSLTDPGAIASVRQAVSRGDAHRCTMLGWAPTPSSVEAHPTSGGGAPLPPDPPTLARVAGQG